MPNTVTIHCAGGCGRSVTLRPSRVETHDFYLCDSRESRNECRAALPPVPQGSYTAIALSAAAHFTGVSYRPHTEESQASVARANRLLRAGLEQNDVVRPSTSSGSGPTRRTR